jgi:hypothetical protein
MGVLGDIFGGDSQKEAAEATRSYLNMTKGQERPAIDAAYAQAMDYSMGYGNSARGALNTGYQQGRGDVGQGAGDALGYLGAGSADAMGRLDAAKGAYTPLSQLGSKYGGATSMALNALGVNGAQGQADARGAFTAGPAYNFNMDQGLDAINRRRAAGGMLNSGNADRDAQIYGAGLASSEYDKWLNNLIGFTNPELAATSGAAAGVAGLGRDQANLSAATGVAQAGVANQRGAMLADLASRFGQNTAASYQNEGTNMSNLAVGRQKDQTALALGIAAPFTKTYKDAADAQTAGSTNLFNFGKEALTTAAKFAGGFA